MMMGTAHRGDAGFSLLETLIVLAILALVTTFVVPTYRRQEADSGVRQAAAALVATARSERAEAMRTSVERRVFLDLDRREYWTASLPRQGIARALALSATVPDGERIANATVRWRFLPDGSSSGGLIELAGGGLRATVTIDWLTGATHVVWSR